MLGFLRGIIYGGLLSVVGLGAASIAVGPPAAPQAVVNAPETTDVPDAGAAPDADAAADADLVTSGAPQVAQPEADDVQSAAATGADTAPVPDTGGTPNPARPEVPADAPLDQVVTSPEAPVLPTPQAALPQEPDAATELSISTVPAQPQAPAPDDSGGAFELPEEPAAPEETVVAALPEPEVQDVAEEAPAAAPTDSETTEAQEPEASVTEEVAVAEETQAEETTSRVGVGRPARTLSLATEAPEEGAEDTAPQSPLDAFAAPFEVTDERPLMSIILIDDGADLSGSAVGPAALSSFPYPLTFAVPGTLPDAAARMQDYRGKGFEVLVMLDLPPGATPQDAEANLRAALAAVPEAIGVLEGPETGVQSDRDAADQIALALKASGHGYVLQAKGLNTVQKLARREGVPAAIVFRDFDSAGQTPTVMRRFLDQAAFRAGQEEAGVIMMGRVRPDTISALLLWGLQDRASRVALAPVSAILKALPETP